jgi:hypothetical protein
MRSAWVIIVAMSLSPLLAACVYLGCPDCYKIRAYDGPDARRYEDPGLRPFWVPTILIAQDDAQHARISCRPKGPGVDTLQVVAHVKNFGRVGGGPFWSKFTVSYTEHPSGNPSTKTYYVNSGWVFSGSSSSGASPQLNTGVLDGGQEADLVVTFDSNFGNLARDLPTGHQNIKFSDAPFTVRVVSNSEDPNNPAAPVPNVATSDRNVTCAG